MKMRMMTVLALLTVASMAGSGIGLVYNSDVSVTQTNSAVTFTDNGSGGIAATFNARHVLVRPLAASTHTCYLDLKDTTATSADIALEPGGSISFSFPETSTGTTDGWPRRAAPRSRRFGLPSATKSLRRTERSTAPPCAARSSTMRRLKADWKPFCIP